MFKRIIYTAMFLVSVVALVFLFALPVYKFDDEKIKSNYVETIARILDDDVDRYREDPIAYKELTDEEKAEYKKQFKSACELALAVIEQDSEKLYNANKYQVLNTIYKNLTGAEGSLTSDSTEEGISTVEKTLTDIYGEDTFTQEKTQVLTAALQKYKDEIYKKVKENTGLKTNKEVDELLITTSIGLVVDELFLNGLDYEYDSEIYTLELSEYRTKGIYLTDFITAWKCAWKIDASIWNQKGLGGLGFIDRVKATVNDPAFYNPFPLFCLSLGILITIISLIILIFKGLQGARGIKYPHAFISSIGNGAIVFAVLAFNYIISMDYYLTYHYIEYSRVLNLYRFGAFSTPLIVSLLAFALGIVVSVLGRLCRWGKPKETKN